MRGSITKRLSAALALGLGVLLFQNCSAVKFETVTGKKPVVATGLPDDKDPTDDPPDTEKPPELCAGVSCDLTPLTSKPAVTTILMALGDAADDQLVVNGASAQFIAESVVRYTSHKTNPKILVVVDHSTHDEDPEDTQYVIDVLLKRYDVTFLQEDATGLTPELLAGFDIVWFNNPGHPMSSQATRDALLGFAGGIVLQGDDLSQGAGFSMESLTGLKAINNGNVVVCNGNSYTHDNNGGSKFSVSLNAQKIPGANASQLSFEYGNDIDLTEVVRSDLEVLATAVGGGPDCTEERPAIVRYIKN
ncbi:MAG TPA: hypothetical protein VM432_02465 [Bdellovibrionales bacterium]|nr:hypothetical protein [Bdellovibrionales bacterium]